MQVRRWLCASKVELIKTARRLVMASVDKVITKRELMREKDGARKGESAFSQMTR